MRVAQLRIFQWKEYGAQAQHLSYKHILSKILAKFNISPNLAPQQTAGTDPLDEYTTKFTNKFTGAKITSHEGAGVLGPLSYAMPPPFSTPPPYEHIKTPSVEIDKRTWRRKKRQRSTLHILRVIVLVFRRSQVLGVLITAITRNNNTTHWPTRRRAASDASFRTQNGSLNRHRRVSRNERNNKCYAIKQYYTRRGACNCAVKAHVQHVCNNVANGCCCAE